MSGPEFSNGVMLALYPHPDVAKKLALPEDFEGASSPDSMHLTLAYLGNKGDEGVPESDTWPELEDIARQVAKRHPPQDAQITGTGQFASGDNGIPFVGLVGSHTIHDLHKDLTSHLKGRGIPVDETYPFSPHMTLAYLGEGQEAPEGFDNPVDLNFGEIVVVHGTNEARFPFSKPAAKTAAKSYQMCIRCSGDGCEVCKESGLAEVCGECGNQTFDPPYGRMQHIYRHDGRVVIDDTGKHPKIAATSIDDPYCKAGKPHNPTAITRHDTEVILPVDYLHDLVQLHDPKMVRSRDSGKYTGEEWDRMVDDVSRRGIKDTITIAVNDSTDTRFPPVEVIDGTHRLGWAKQTGQKSIPAEVRYFGDAIHNDPFDGFTKDAATEKDYYKLCPACDGSGERYPSVGCAHCGSSGLVENKPGPDFVLWQHPEKGLPSLNMPEFNCPECGNQNNRVKWNGDGFVLMSCNSCGTNYKHSLMREGWPRTAGSKKQSDPREVLDQLRQTRSEVRVHEIGHEHPDAGQCGLVSEENQMNHGWDIDAGFYIDPDPQTPEMHKGFGDHVWNVTSDGTIVDASHDQFHDPDVNILPPGHPDRVRYHSYCNPEENPDCKYCSDPDMNPDFGHKIGKLYYRQKDYDAFHIYTEDGSEKTVCGKDLPQEGDIWVDTPPKKDICPACRVWHDNELKKTMEDARHQDIEESKERFPPPTLEEKHQPDHTYAGNIGEIDYLKAGCKCGWGTNVRSEQAANNAWQRHFDTLNEPGRREKAGEPKDRSNIPVPKRHASGESPRKGDYVIHDDHFSGDYDYDYSIEDKPIVSQHGVTKKDGGFEVPRISYCENKKCDDGIVPCEVCKGTGEVEDQMGYSLHSGCGGKGCPGCEDSGLKLTNGQCQDCMAGEAPGSGAELCGDCYGSGHWDNAEDSGYNNSHELLPGLIQDHQVSDVWHVKDSQDEGQGKWSGEYTKCTHLRNHPGQEQLFSKRHSAVQVTREIAENLVRRIKEEGGFSVDPHTWEDAEEGYAVAQKGNEKKHHMEEFSADHVLSYLNEASDKLSHPDALLGGWKGGSDGKAYLDVSRKYETIQDAREVANRNYQMTIYRLKKTKGPKDEGDERDALTDTEGNPLVGLASRQIPLHPALLARALQQVRPTGRSRRRDGTPAGQVHPSQSGTPQPQSPQQPNPELPAPSRARRRGSSDPVYDPRRSRGTRAHGEPRQPSSLPSPGQHEPQGSSLPPASRTSASDIDHRTAYANSSRPASYHDGWKSVKNAHEDWEMDYLEGPHNEDDHFHEPDQPEHGDYIIHDEQIPEDRETGRDHLLMGSNQTVAEQVGGRFSASPVQYCDTCDTEGTVETDYVICAGCKGEGSVAIPGQSTNQECRTCEGSGLERNEEYCKDCEGAGVVTSTQEEVHKEIYKHQEKEGYSPTIWHARDDGRGGKEYEPCDHWKQYQKTSAKEVPNIEYNICSLCKGTGTYKEKGTWVWQAPGKPCSLCDGSGLSLGCSDCGTDLVEDPYAGYIHLFKKGDPKEQKVDVLLGRDDAPLDPRVCPARSQTKTAHGDNEHFYDEKEDDYRTHTEEEGDSPAHDPYGGGHHDYWDYRDGQHHGYDVQFGDYLIDTTEFHDEGNRSADDRLGGSRSRPSELAWQHEVRSSFVPDDIKTCDDCDGEGIVTDCDHCGGKGHLDKPEYSIHENCGGKGCKDCGDSGLDLSYACGKCGGPGGEECKSCDGQGSLGTTLKDVHHQVWEQQHDDGEYNSVFHYESYGANEKLEPCDDDRPNACDGATYKDWEKEYHAGNKKAMEGGSCKSCGYQPETTKKEGQAPPKCPDCGNHHDDDAYCSLADEYDPMCPACGERNDYCRGHGEIGDPAGAKILERHDANIHDQCHPDGCGEAGPYAYQPCDRPGCDNGIVNKERSPRGLGKPGDCEKCDGSGLMYERIEKTAAWLDQVTAPYQQDAVADPKEGIDPEMPVMYEEGMGRWPDDTEEAPAPNRGAVDVFSMPKTGARGGIAYRSCRNLRHQESGAMDCADCDDSGLEPICASCGKKVYNSGWGKPGVGTWRHYYTDADVDCDNFKTDPKILLGAVHNQGKIKYEVCRNVIHTRDRSNEYCFECDNSQLTPICDSCEEPAVLRKDGKGWEHLFRDSDRSRDDWGYQGCDNFDSILDHVMDHHDQYQTYPLLQEGHWTTHGLPTKEELERGHEELGPHEHLGSKVAAPTSGQGYAPCPQCKDGNCSSVHEVSLGDWDMPARIECEGQCTFCGGSGLLLEQDEVALGQMDIQAVEPLPGEPRRQLPTVKTTKLDKTREEEIRYDHYGADQGSDGQAQAPQAWDRGFKEARGSHVRKVAEDDEDTEVVFPSHDDLVEWNRHHVERSGEPHNVDNPEVSDWAIGMAEKHYDRTGDFPSTLAHLAHRLAAGQMWQNVGDQQVFAEGNHRTSAVASREFAHANGHGHLLPHDEDPEFASILISDRDPGANPGKVIGRLTKLFNERDGAKTSKTATQRVCMKCKKIFDYSEDGEHTGFCQTCREKEGLVTHHSWSEDMQEGHYGAKNYLYHVPACLKDVDSIRKKGLIPGAGRWTHGWTEQHDAVYLSKEQDSYGDAIFRIDTSKLDPTKITSGDDEDLGLDDVAYHGQIDPGVIEQVRDVDPSTCDCMACESDVQSHYGAKYYHAAPVKYRESIESEGLHPRSRSLEYGPGQSGIFLYSDVNQAQRWAEARGGRDVYEVDVDHELDPDMELYDFGSVVSQQAIPPHRIRRLGTVDLPPYPEGEAGIGQLYGFCPDCFGDTPEAYGDKCALCDSTKPLVWHWQHPVDGEGTAEWAQWKQGLPYNTDITYLGEEGPEVVAKHGANKGGQWEERDLLFNHMKDQHGLTREDLDLKHMALGHEYQHRQGVGHSHEKDAIFSVSSARGRG